MEFPAAVGPTITPTTGGSGSSANFVSHLRQRRKQLDAERSELERQNRHDEAAIVALHQAIQQRKIRVTEIAQEKVALKTHERKQLRLEIEEAEQELRRKMAMLRELEEAEDDDGSECTNNNNNNVIMMNEGGLAASAAATFAMCAMPRSASFAVGTPLGNSSMASAGSVFSERSISVPRERPRTHAAPAAGEQPEQRKQETTLRNSWGSSAAASATASSDWGAVTQDFGTTPPAEQQQQQHPTQELRCHVGHSSWSSSDVLRSSAKLSPVAFTGFSSPDSPFQTATTSNKPPSGNERVAVAQYQDIVSNKTTHQKNSDAMPPNAANKKGQNFWNPYEWRKKVRKDLQSIDRQRSLSSGDQEPSLSGHDSFNLQPVAVETDGVFLTDKNNKSFQGSPAFLMDHLLGEEERDPSEADMVDVLVRKSPSLQGRNSDASDAGTTASAPTLSVAYHQAYKEPHLEDDETEGFDTEYHEDTPGHETVAGDEESKTRKNKVSTKAKTKEKSQEPVGEDETEVFEGEYHDEAPEYESVAGDEESKTTRVNVPAATTSNETSAVVEDETEVFEGEYHHEAVGDEETKSKDVGRDDESKDVEQPVAAGDETEVFSSEYEAALSEPLPRDHEMEIKEVIAVVPGKLSGKLRATTPGRSSRKWIGKVQPPLAIFSSKSSASDVAAARKKKSNNFEYC